MIGGLGRHFGGGVWGGLGRWFSPGSASTPSLVEMDYLLGLESPVRFGTRAVSVLAAPRGRYRQRHARPRRRRPGATGLRLGSAGERALVALPSRRLDDG